MTENEKMKNHTHTHGNLIFKSLIFQKQKKKKFTTKIIIETSKIPRH